MPGRDITHIRVMVFATNKAATNAAPVVRASNPAGFPKEKSNGNRTSKGRGRDGVEGEPVSGSAEAVEQMGLDGPAGLQRGVQLDGSKPGLVPASKAGEGVAKPLADNSVERCMDGGWSGALTKNRRTRAAYNAYQREYMRRRRSRTI